MSKELDTMNVTNQENVFGLPRPYQIHCTIIQRPTLVSECV